MTEPKTSRKKGIREYLAASWRVLKESESTRPYLFGKLRAGDASEQIGASLGLAEVFVRMEKARR